jgi:hypothetical protein
MLLGGHLGYINHGQEVVAKIDIKRFKRKKRWNNGEAP